MNQEELRQRLVELTGHIIVPYFTEQITDYLIANNVTIRDRGEWIFNLDGSGTCNRCGKTQAHVWDFDNFQNFCGNCGADMRVGGQGNDE